MFQPQPTPLANAVVFINHPNRTNVFIAENQMNYTVDGDHIEFERDGWFRMLDGLRDTLMLDNQFSGMIQIVSHVASNASSTEMSVRCFSPLPEEEMRNRFVGLRGVGLRINYERPGFVCDMHLEPFFQDPTRFFLRLNAAGQQPRSLDTLVQDMDDLYGFMNNDAVSFLEESLRD